MDIDKMEAGRELDALVAEKVMGLEPCDKWELFRHGGLSGPEWIHDVCQEDHTCYPKENPSAYSTDIAAAWKVVERLCELPSVGIIIKAYPKWNEKHERNFLYEYVATFPDLGLQAVADTAPLAICRAALKAILNGNP